MLSLFYKRDNIQYPIQLDATVDVLRKISNNELKKIKNYLQNKNSRVANSNILARVIDMLDIDYNLNMIDYLNELDAQSKQISKHFKFSSNIFTGNMLYNNIYNNSKEVFIYIESDINPFEIENNWGDITSVKLLKHENTDLRFMVPDYTDNRSGLYVYNVDIKLMLVQYKLWCEYRIGLDMSTDSTYFVYQYVYSNMLESYVNISVFNRLLYLNKGIPIIDKVNPYPFPVRDLSRKVDKILYNILKKITNKKKRYVELLKWIPNITNEDTMYNTLFLEESYFNKNNRWTYFLSRLEYMDNIIDIAGKSSMNVNKIDITNLRLSIKDLKRNNYLQNGYSEYYEEDVLDIIETINDKIGER